MGVDVDENDGVINFTALKNAGVDFVMVRIGYRGYQSGNITLWTITAMIIWRMPRRRDCM